MIALTWDRILDRISKKTKIENCTLLRFNKGKEFSPSDSTIEPRKLIEIIESLEKLGPKFLGGYTDRGVCKLVNVYENVKEWMRKAREDVGFCNLYGIFFETEKPIFGLLMLYQKLAIFIPTIDYSLPIRITCIPKQEKERVRNLAKKFGLTFWGDPSAPVLYRVEKLTIENSVNFWKAVSNFFEEIGTIEV